MRAEICIPGPEGSLGRIQIDDVPLRGIAGFTLTHRVGEGHPRLAVELRAREVRFETGHVELDLPDGTRDLLIKFGWTPPADG